MKKFLSLLMTAVMAAALLAGCGAESTQSASTESTEEVTGEVTLKIAHNMDFVTIPDAVLAAGERLNAKYAAEGKDLVIKFETDYQHLDWTEYHNNVVFAEKNGEGPDIFSLDTDVNGFVKAGMLLDISDLMTEDFVDGSFAPFMVDGKAYGMPFDLPVRVLYYNKKALEQIGWSAEEIEALPGKMASGEFTWEQFKDLCKEVQEKGAATWGLAHRPGPGGDFLDILTTLGGSYYDENGKLLFDSEGLLRFFTELHENANVTKITPQDLNQMGWPTINTMVGDGTAFAYYGPAYSTTYVAKAVNKTPEELVQDVGFAVFPASEYNEKPFCTAAPQGMGINANTKYPEICKDLFRELYAGESVSALAHHSDTIFALSSVKAANETEDVKTNPVLKEIGYMADLSVPEITCDGLRVFTTEMHKQICLVELGQATPEEAVENLKVQMEVNLGEDVISFK